MLICEDLRLYTSYNIFGYLILFWISEQPSFEGIIPKGFYIFYVFN